MDVDALFKGIIAALSDSQQRQFVRDLRRQQGELQAQCDSLQRANTALHEDLNDERRESAEAVRQAQAPRVDNDALIESLRHEIVGLKRSVEERERDIIYWKALAETNDRLRYSAEERATQAAQDKANAVREAREAMDEATNKFKARLQETLQHTKEEEDRRKEVERKLDGLSYELKDQRVLLVREVGLKRDLSACRNKLQAERMRAENIDKELQSLRRAQSQVKQEHSRLSNAPETGVTAAGNVDLKMEEHEPPAKKEDPDTRGFSQPPSSGAQLPTPPPMDTDTKPSMHSSASRTLTDGDVSQREVIDLSLDSGDEVPQIPLDGYDYTADIRMGVLPDVQPPPVPPARSNASAGPGPSTVNNRVKRGRKRVIDSGTDEQEHDALPSQIPKRRKNASSADNAFSFNPTKALKAMSPPSLNQRVAHMQSLPLTLPLEILPSEAHPCTGWVKRDLVSRQHKTQSMQFLTTLKHIPGQPETFSRPAIFAKVEHNPGLPLYPGQPGTLITSRSLALEVPTSIFVRAVAHAWWLYVGEHDVVKSRPMTGDEWKRLPQAARKEWAQKLSGDVKREAYRRVSIRIALCRKHGVALVTDEMISRELEQCKDKQYPARLRLTDDEVLEGLERGYGTLDVYTLQPVSVDEGLYTGLWSMQRRNTNTSTTTGKTKKKGTVAAHQNGVRLDLNTLPKVRRGQRARRPPRRPDENTSAQLSDRGADSDESENNGLYIDSDLSELTDSDEE